MTQNCKDWPGKTKGEPTTKWIFKQILYFFADVVSKTELPIGIQEEAHLKTSSSNNDGEASKLSVDTEVIAHMETDKSVDDTLLNSQMVATENSLLAQKYFPQKGKKQLICSLMHKFWNKLGLEVA